MSRIPDEVIDEIREVADLVAIIGESVELRRTGADWRGPCPFHHGKDRNFAVIPRKGIYHCFVCHASGTVFDWFMQRFGMDYPSAVREAARRAGVVVPERGEREEGPDPHAPLRSAVAAAQEWYARTLQESPQAEAARAYLRSRDITPEAAALQGLGFAPRGDAFAGAMRALGVRDEVLLEAGLLVRRDDGSVHPRFGNRLLFPIHDLRGRPVAFGGRLVGEGPGPKYLNSPDTPIFHKGQLLYHLHAGRPAIRREGSAVLVEGYFDVLRLVLAGLEHVVAPLGTGLSPEQAQLLRRVTGSVTLLYDSDQAGLKATFRAADVLLAHGLRVLVATMPPGEDPDSLVRARGRAGIDAVLQDAVDVLERKIQLLDRKGWFAGVAHQREALDRLLPTLRAPSDPLTRELYVSRVAERLGVPRETIAAEVARARATAPAPAPRCAVERTVPAAAPRRPPGARQEETLLRLLLLRPDWRARAATEVSAALIEVPAFRAVFEFLVSPEGTRATEPPATFDDRLRAVWQRLLEASRRDEGLDIDQTYEGALAALRLRADLRALQAERDPAARIRRKRELQGKYSAADMQRLGYSRARGRGPEGAGR